jgi:hypothetical protein
MPFREFFTRRGARHPVAYSNLTLVAGILAVMGITLYAALSMFQQSQEEGRARQRAAVCAVADRMVEVYENPETRTGREAGAAWRDLRRIFDCDGGSGE